MIFVNISISLRIYFSSFEQGTFELINRLIPLSMIPLSMIPLSMIPLSMIPLCSTHPLFVILAYVHPAYRNGVWNHSVSLWGLTLYLPIFLFFFQVRFALIVLWIFWICFSCNHDILKSKTIQYDSLTGLPSRNINWIFEKIQIKALAASQCNHWVCFNLVNGIKSKKVEKPSPKSLFINKWMRVVDSAEVIVWLL